MPNWSYNILNAPDEVLKQIVNEEGEIDFNTVVPMPKELQGTVSPRKDDTQEEKDASKNLIKDPETADRNYDMSDDNQNNESDNNYYEFCGYYLVPYKGGGPFKRIK